MNSFFKRLGHFFVIQPIGRGIYQALAVRDCDATPRITQGRQIGTSPFTPGQFSLVAHGATVFQKCLKDFLLFRIAHAPDALFTEMRAHLFELLQCFLDLHRVVGQYLGGRVDGGQAPADNDRGESHLQICQRRFLESTRQALLVLSRRDPGSNHSDGHGQRARIRDAGKRREVQLTMRRGVHNQRWENQTPHTLSPNLQAHVARSIQTLKFECLDKFVIVAEKHPDHICRVRSLHRNEDWHRAILYYVELMVPQTCITMDYDGLEAMSTQMKPIMEERMATVPPGEDNRPETMVDIIQAVGRVIRKAAGRHTLLTFGLVVAAFGFP